MMDLALFLCPVATAPMDVMPVDSVVRMAPVLIVSMNARQVHRLLMPAHP
jgi:hypothetical protein